MGGMIALDWMHRYHHEIQAAVLINTSVRPIARFYRRLRWQIYGDLITMLLHSSDLQQQDILQLTSNHHQEMPEQLLQSWRLWQQQCPVSRASAVNQLRAAASFYMLEKPALPMLVVTSTADRLVDYRCSLYLQHLWHTDYRQHSTAGHDIALDEPEWLASEIKDWLQKKQLC